MREDLDFLFSPVYLQLTFALKSVLMFVRIVWGDRDWVKVPGILIIHGALLLINYQMQPCCVKVVNIWRTASFCGSCWLGVCAVVHLIFRDDWEGPDRQLSNVVAALLLSGWAVLAVGTAYVSSHARQSSLQIAAAAFVGFEYAHRLQKIPPRALEPLIALTMSKEEEDADAAMHFAEKMLILLRRSAAIPGDMKYESQGTRFKRMRTLSKVCVCRGTWRVWALDGFVATSASLFA
jgi:hypothetical protein